MKKPKKKGALLAVFGDTHVNSTLALCPPRVTLNEGGDYVSSKVQRFIWRSWLEYWRWIADERKRLGWPVFAVGNGDLSDDNYHKTTELISKHEETINNMVRATMKPAVDVADHFVIIRGTPAHVHLSAALDERTAKDITTIIPMDEDREIYSWRKWRPKICGVSFDITHHPGVASRVPQTRGSESIRLANKIEKAYSRRRVPYPDVAIRGHNHVPADSYDNQALRAIIQPSWQAPTDYIDRLGIDDVPPVGGLLIYCEGGQYEVKKFYKEWPISELRVPDFVY